MVIKTGAHLSKNLLLISLLLARESNKLGVTALFCCPLNHIISTNRPSYILLVGCNWFKWLRSVELAVCECLLLWATTEFADGSGSFNGAFYAIGDVRRGG
jgi:hypothetical protein